MAPRQASMARRTTATSGRRAGLTPRRSRPTAVSSRSPPTQPTSLRPMAIRLATSTSAICRPGPRRWSQGRRASMDHLARPTPGSPQSRRTVGSWPSLRRRRTSRSRTRTDPRTSSSAISPHRRQRSFHGAAASTVRWVARSQIGSQQMGRGRQIFQPMVGSCSSRRLQTTSAISTVLGTTCSLATHVPTGQCSSRQPAARCRAPATTPTVVSPTTVERRPTRQVNGGSFSRICWAFVAICLPRRSSARGSQGFVGRT